MVTSNPLTEPGGAPRTDPFKALGDPTRRRIVEALASGERSVDELAKRLDASLVLVSQHLQVLYSAGLVERRKQGRRRLYRLDGRTLAGLRAWLDAQQGRWQRALDGLEEFLDRRP